MSVFLLLLGCGGAPSFYGPEEAEDQDPAEDVWEYHLKAAEGQADWGIGEGTAVWSYNGGVPGPTLRARVGDTLRVALDNALPEADTTIHWHGMRVPNEMDGTGWVQDPIAPGEGFTYEFTVPDAGTFWYHPHIRSNEAVERGLYGAIVIEDPDEPVADVERVLVLDDVDIQPDGEIAPFDLEASLINTTHGRLGNTLLLNGQPIASGPLVVEARAGQVERWRLVNAANARTFDLEISGADWRLVAEDGQLLDAPQTLDHLTLASGQRADLEVLPGEADVVLTEWIRTPDAEDMPYDALRAVVAHPGSPAEGLDWPAPELPEPREAEQEVELVLDGYDDGTVMTWTMNGEAWMGCEDMLGGTPFTFQADTPTLITVRNDSSVEHPFHLHGQFMLEVKRNGEPPAWQGLRDTVLVEPSEEVALYSLLENPGIWMAHCHILEHAARGMMTAFEVVP